MTYLHNPPLSQPRSLLSALPHISILSDLATLPLGRRLAGRYRLESLLRQGASSEIYRAFDEKEARPCAIKLRRRHAQAVDETARLHHENIVEVRSAARDLDGTPLLVMELLEGVNLEELLTATGALTLAQALPVLRGVADALQFAHDRGVVHGDVTPAHVFLCAPRLRDAADGLRPGVLAQVRVKLLGFGPARRGDGAQAGTPAYLSPEALLPGVVLDGRADQWSLAVVAYQMISGQRPLGAAAPALCRMIRREQPMPFARLVPGLPMHVCAALDVALSKDRSARFERVVELVRALEGSQALSALTTLPPVARTTSRRLAVAQAVPQFIPPERMHRTDAPRAVEQPVTAQDRTAQYSVEELQALLRDGGAAEPASFDDAIDAPTRKYDLALLDAVVRAEVVRPTRERFEPVASPRALPPTGPVRVTPPLPQGAPGRPPADALGTSGIVQRIAPECTEWVRFAEADPVSGMPPISDLAPTPPLLEGTVWFQPPTLLIRAPVRGPGRLHIGLVLLVCTVLLCAAVALCARMVALQ